MDLNVIAEGVETAQQQNFLRDEGCLEGQVFLYSQAIPDEAFTKLLEKNTA